jgi:hypothetical protein
MLLVQRVVFTVDSVVDNDDARAFYRRMSLFALAIKLKRADVNTKVDLTSAGLLIVNLSGRDANWGMWTLFGIITGPLIRGKLLFHEPFMTTAA